MTNAPEHNEQHAWTNLHWTTLLILSKLRSESQISASKEQADAGDERQDEADNCLLAVAQ